MTEVRLARYKRPGGTGQIEERSVRLESSTDYSIKKKSGLYLKVWRGAVPKEEGQIEANGQEGRGVQERQDDCGAK